MYLIKWPVSVFYNTVGWCLCHPSNFISLHVKNRFAVLSVSHTHDIYFFSLKNEHFSSSVDQNLRGQNSGCSLRISFCKTAEENQTEQKEEGINWLLVWQIIGLGICHFSYYRYVFYQPANFLKSLLLRCLHSSEWRWCAAPAKRPSVWEHKILTAFFLDLLFRYFV